VYDVGEHEQHEFLSMEFLPGGDLRSRVSQNPGLEAALAVCIPMAFALGYAHGKGVVHRDVKPENILFREDGTPVLSDFGIARAADAGTALTQTGMLIGTPAYVSPEQAKGVPLDGRTDLYSLGIVFYELLTGAQPYRADSAISVVLKHLNDAIPTLPPHLAHAQPFLERALAKEPDERFATAAEMVQAMQGLLPSNYASGQVVTPSGDYGTGRAPLLGTAVTLSDPNLETLIGSSATDPALSATTVRHLPSPTVRYETIIGAAIVLAASVGLYMLVGGEPSSFTVDSARAQVEAVDPAQAEMTRMLTEAGVARLSNDMPQAETLYRRVLTSDDTNKIALDGMQSIAEQYRNMARDALAAKDLPAAQDAVSHAIAIEPEDPQAEKLQSELQRLREEQ
jgi:serine/threonine-protein kinase PpkA